MSYFLFGLARADPLCRGQPPHLVPRIVVQTIVALLPSQNPVPQLTPQHPGSSRLHPQLSPRDSPGRQSSCGFDWDKYEPRYRFRWDTCPFFFLHRALSIADFPPGSPMAISSLLLPFSFSPLSHSFSLFVTNSRN